MRIRFRIIVFLSLFLSCVSVGAVDVGITNDSITLGQSAAFTGPAGQLGKDLREGALVYFEWINRLGGIYGRKIRLTSLDDGYEPQLTVSNTAKLINTDQVFALFGYVGTPTSYAVLPQVTAAKVPFFSPFTGAAGLRQFNKYIFNVRASYDSETARIVSFLQSQKQMRIAVFYQNDAYGKAGLDGVLKALGELSLKPVALGTVERNSQEVGAAVASIAQARPQAVIMISAYKSCAAFIRSYRSSVPPKVLDETTFANVSFVGSEALASELGEDGHGVIISQVVPYPWDPGIHVVAEFRKLIAATNSETKISFNTLEGFIDAKVFVEGLQRAGENPTREAFIAALETFDNVNFGGFVISFSPNNHNGSHFVQLTTILGANGKFVYLN